MCLFTPQLLLGTHWNFSYKFAPKGPIPSTILMKFGMGVEMAVAVVLPRIKRAIIVCPWKLDVGSFNTMAPINRSYATFYDSAVVSIALSCAVLEIFDIEACRNCEIKFVMCTLLTSFDLMLSFCCWQYGSNFIYFLTVSYFIYFLTVSS